MKGFFQKFWRYAAVSLISTSVTLSLLGLLVYTRALSPGWANVVATAAGTVPSFELNRRWVWAKRTKRSLLKGSGTVLRPVVRWARAVHARRQAGRGMVGGGRYGPGCRGALLSGRQPDDFRFSMVRSVFGSRPGAVRSPVGPNYSANV